MRIYRARTHHESTYLIALTVPLRLSRPLEYGLRHPALFALCGLPLWHFGSPSACCEKA